MKKSTSSLNVKKKILVKSILFGCAILCPILISVHSASATYDSVCPLFSPTYDPEILDHSYAKHYSNKTDDPSVFPNNKKPDLYVHNYSIEEIFPEDLFKEFWDMKTETSRNTKENIAEKVKEQTSQYDGDYPTYKEECEDIISQYYKDKESTISRHTPDFTPLSTKEGMKNYRQSIEQLSAELNELKQKCQNDLSSLGTRAYEDDFHNYDLISKGPYWATFWD